MAAAAAGHWCLPFGMSGLGGPDGRRTRFVWVWSGLPRPARPRPAQPARGEDAARQLQRPLRQAEVGRGGAAPSPEPRLPPGAARSLPLAPQPVGGRSPGGPGTWAPPSHPPSHSHTAARTHPLAASRAPSLADTPGPASVSGPARRARTPSSHLRDRPSASSCSSLGSCTAASFAAAGTRPFSHCCSCRADALTVMTRSRC